MSALGFACFGGMIANLGDLRGGYRFTKLAKALLKNNFSNEIAGEVMWITSDTLSYIEPLQANSAYRIEAQKLALVAGDVNGACFNKALWVCDLMWSGSPLSNIKEAISSTKQVSNLLKLMCYPSNKMNAHTSLVNQVLRKIRASNRVVLFNVI